MRRALTYLFLAIVVGLSGYSAERRSWNKIRYAGGTIAVKASPYDWNTTLTVTTQPPSIVVTIAPASVFTPKQTVHIAPGEVTSVSYGQAAWRRVGAVAGALLPPQPPALFGLLRDNSFLGIVYQSDGKPAAMLLDTRQGWQILTALKQVTGKSVEDFP
jgi:hypothetical protein